MSAHQRGLTHDQVLANYHTATDSALVRMGIDVANVLFGTESLKVGAAERFARTRDLTIWLNWIFSGVGRLDCDKFTRIAG